MGKHIQKEELDTALANKVSKVTSTDNAIARFDGATGDVKNSLVTIDDSCNVGIGVTPSVWSSRSKSLVISDADRSGYVIESYYNGNTALQVAVNTGVGFYRNTSGVFVYSNSFIKPVQLSFYNGSFSYNIAKSDTEGNPITWNTAMTLASSGNLLVGTTTDNGVDKLQVNGSVFISNSINHRGQKKITNFAYNHSGGLIFTSAYFGNVQTMGELYVVEIGTDKYLRAIFYKEGTYYIATCTVLASNGLTLGACNANGTQVINGATNNNNIRMISEIKTVY